MKKKSIKQDIQPMLISVHGASVLLGLSTWTIRKWIRMGKLSVSSLSKRPLLVDYSELEALIKQSLPVKVEVVMEA
jgi:hypothetical protein